MEEGYDSIAINWTVTDSDPSTYTIEQNGTEIVSVTAWTSEIEIVFDIPLDLEVGNYTFTITIYDDSGNYIQDVQNIQ